MDEDRVATASLYNLSISLTPFMSVKSKRSNKYRGV